MSACKKGRLCNFLIFILILGITTILLLVYMKPSNSWSYSPPSVRNAQSLFSQQIAEEENRTIVLIWMWPADYVFSLTSCESRFNIHHCLLTRDRYLYYKSHAVIMHHWDIRADLSNLPKQSRPRLQKWIWMNMESPTHSPPKKRLRRLFNLTLTYRQDSDIYVPYGTLIKSPNSSDFKIPQKSKLLCWIVSHWNRKFQRVKYYKQLVKYIKISVHGRSFRKHLNDIDSEQLLASCKFYLAFENSIHKDYVTEKFYKALNFGTVPVVLGPSRENYEIFVPADSFIHVDDFPSAKELAEYLHRIDRDPVKYKRYFNWRKNYKVQLSDWEHRVCVACEYIKRNNNYRGTRNLEEWFWD